MIRVAVYTKGDAFLTLLEDNNWFINLLIVDKESDKEHAKKIISLGGYNNVNEIVTVEDFFCNNDMTYLCKENIEMNFGSQVKFYQYLYRFTRDIQLISDAYYRSLAYTEKLFKLKDIDCVINMNFNHGNCDVLLTQIAVYKGIPSYNIEPMLSEKMIVYDNMIDDLMLLRGNVDDIKKSFFYKVDNDAYDFDENRRYKFIKKTIGKLFYTFGGELGWRLLGCASNRSFMFTEMFGKKSLIEFYKNYIRLLLAKHYLKKIEVMPNYDESYIFFPLHFEPEATVNGRSILTNQLDVIRIIAQSMPKGMVCYVKEHPHQFNVNSHRYCSFLYSAGNFKTKDFYKELRKIRRVKIINHKIMSEDLIKNSKAVAIMSGTVGAEATTFDKPVIVFAAKRTIYRKVKGFYCVESFEECKDAINKICENPKCVYEDFNDICKQYLVNESIDGFRHAVKSIQVDFNEKMHNK